MPSRLSQFIYTLLWIVVLFLSLPLHSVLGQEAQSQPGPADSSRTDQVPPDSSQALAEPPEPEPPLAPPLSPAVVQLIEDPLNTPAQKRAMQIFHGQWESLSDPSSAEQAAIALARYDLNHPVFSDVSVPAALRAAALLERGQPQLARQALADASSIEAMWITSQAMTLQGQLEDATKLLKLIDERVNSQASADAHDLTIQGQAIIALAELQGGSASEYQRALETLGKAYRVADRLYYPAMVAQADLLASRDNPTDAQEALNDAAVLNPNDGQLWSVLGHMAADHFNFEMTTRALKQLRAINPHHLLADRLEAYAKLVQRDPAASLAVLGPAMGRYPHDPHLLALSVAAEAAIYDQPAYDKAMAAFDAQFPHSELALLTAGKVLSMNRQYARAETLLRQTIERRPNLPVAWVELGLLLMQFGHEPQAMEALQRAVILDPFDKRAINQLKLVQEMLGYQTIETEHFLIRFRQGIDAVLARDMPEPLERMYVELTGIFQHRPRNRTIIEILPDMQRFAVRIVGMPDIWTIGASTGDIIAITPPRDGRGQHGAFDWLRVIRHEFVHTITLDQTSNRIAHWFTEGAAVWQEPGDRDYNTARLLAEALQARQLFTLDQINWGFIRPKREIDRPLAYAQACWMIQYIVATYHQQAVVDMLRLFNEGLTDRQAIEKVTHRSGDQFMEDFTQWAVGQVASWGLAPSPYDKRAQQLLASAGTLEASVLAELLKQYPHDPELLLLVAQKAMAGPDANAALQAVLNYAAARPVDPWAHEALVELALKQGQPIQALGSLAHLDLQEQNSGAWALRMAGISREAGDLPAAYQAMLRAIHREPYNATYREQAAAIALQNGQMEQALFQLQALPMLEPDRVIHHIRLAAIYTKMGRGEEARAAALAARAIDPHAAVDAFLKIP